MRNFRLTKKGFRKFVLVSTIAMLFLNAILSIIPPFGDNYPTKLVARYETLEEAASANDIHCEEILMTAETDNFVAVYYKAPNSTSRSIHYCDENGYTAGIGNFAIIATTLGYRSYQKEISIKPEFGTHVNVGTAYIGGKHLIYCDILMGSSSEKSIKDYKVRDSLGSQFVDEWYESEGVFSQRYLLAEVEDLPSDYTIYFDDVPFELNKFYNSSELKLGSMCILFMGIFVFIVGSIFLRAKDKHT